MGFEELHALGTTVTVEDCEETDEFPFAASDIFFDDESVLHGGAEADVDSHSAVVPLEFEHEVADFELAVEGEGEDLAGLYAAEYFLVGDESSFDDFGNGLFAGEEVVGVVAEVIVLPADLDG
jgi:hypothetical protein